MHLVKITCQEKTVNLAYFGLSRKVLKRFVLQKRAKVW
jgi:hypothetical protein